MIGHCRRAWKSWALLALLPLVPQDAHAGGGPENVVLVVNSASWASRTLANYYVHLRAIPPGNIIEIDWRGGCETVEVDQFRDKILGPVLLEIDRRRLGDQIDYIVYSSDFPCAVNLASDFRAISFPPHVKEVLSINSATYFWQAVMARSPASVGLRNNQYMRAAAGRKTDSPTHGFRSWYGWGPGGELLETGGQRYALSTMLAVTSGRGNSVSEAVSYLTRSAAADGTRPPGTIYFCQNGDVRSTTRQAGTDAAVADLAALGVRGEVVDAQLPTNKSDVAGAMLGLASFSWRSSASTIRPGAICEHLTSFGGMLVEGSGQTPLTELLRYGAAGASGTVIEPFAMQDKFPVPAIHVHYARGCTLAEAFYQSVFGPFQLLIVGDPLCRPWATIPTVQVDGVRDGQSISGSVTLRLSASTKGGPAVDRFELFVDGRRVAVAPGGEPLPLDTRQMADGYHELRVVAIEASDIETQGRLILGISVDNKQQTATLSGPSTKSVPLGETVSLMVDAPGAKAVSVLHAGSVVGKLAGEHGQVEVDTRRLGSGPIRLQAVAEGASPSRRAVSRPLSLNITAVPLPALAREPVGQLVGGMQLTNGGKTVPVQSTRDANWLVAAGVKPGEAFTLEAYFRAPETDAYQCQAWHQGSLAISVDDREIYTQSAGQFDQQFIPVALAKGMHKLQVTGQAGENGQLRLMFGGHGTESLSGSMFRHPQ